MRLNADMMRLRGFRAVRRHRASEEDASGLLSPRFFGVDNQRAERLPLHKIAHATREYSSLRVCSVLVVDAASALTVRLKQLMKCCKATSKAHWPAWLNWCRCPASRQLANSCRTNAELPFVAARIRAVFPICVCMCVEVCLYMCIVL